MIERHLVTCSRCVLGNAHDVLAFRNRHRSGRTARGSGQGKVTALVAKRDKVLAMAIEQAVRRGDTLDGLSSRKSDYGPGGPQSRTRVSTKPFSNRRDEGRVRSSGQAKKNNQGNMRKSSRAP